MHENIDSGHKSDERTEVYSDHYLVRTRIKLKLSKAHGKKRVRFDICHLRGEEINRRYNTELENSFEALGDIEDPEEEQDKILVTYRDAAEKVNGRSKKQSKPWIGDKTQEGAGEEHFLCQLH